MPVDDRSAERDKKTLEIAPGASLQQIATDLDREATPANLLCVSADALEDAPDDLPDASASPTEVDDESRADRIAKLLVLDHGYTDEDDGDVPAGDYYWFRRT